MILALLTTHAATPQAAALEAVTVDVMKPPRIVRTNVAGRYATVLTRGTTMEGYSIGRSPLLVARFSFGWQPLEVLTTRCDLSEYRLGGGAEAVLMQGMPKLSVTRSVCRSRIKDSGPAQQVEAVRLLMRGPLIPSVVVAGQWALGTWYGAGGGESLYRLRHGRWKFVTGGGGAMGVSVLFRYGVPHSYWCTLGVYDCKTTPE